MSGSTLSLLSDALSAITGWRVQLQPGSFRAVPFYMNTAELTGGRRLVTHEYPQRDIPAVEDLGQKANVFRLQLFVVGNDYMIFRDALIAACQNFNDAATLIHPTMGSILCRAGALRCTENPRELGGYALFEIDFHKEGVQPGLITGTDTASQLLGAINSMLAVGLTAYVLVSAVKQNPALLLGFAGSLLGGAASTIFGLSTTALAGIAGVAGSITAAVLNDTATATAVQSSFQAIAQNVIAAQTIANQPDDPVLGTTLLIAPAADLTGGLAALATWGDTLAAPVGAGAALTALQTQQAAIVALVEGSATIAVLTVYANTTFTSSNAAAAARVQVLALCDRQAEAANLAGQDDLYRAWLALTGIAMNDLIQRAQQLPALVGFTTPVSLPGVVLGQIYYQDAARGDEIAALNDVPHPMFMPLSGVRLSL